MKKVLILGAYGNFGSHITRSLAAETDIRVIISGRNQEKCQQLATELQKSPNLPLYHALDAHKDFAAVLERVKPDIVIHTSGPFQGQGYHVAEACIAHGCHYIDLADARDFVTNIKALDAKAKEKGVTVISGASSVPALSAALIDYYLPQFRKITKVDYAISTAPRSSVGLATTSAVFSYAGKTFTTLIGKKMSPVYGAQDMIAHNYPELGLRLIGNCDVPDLDIFPARYKDLEDLRFRAGRGRTLLQFGLWMLSWMVRWGLIKNLASHAEGLLNISRRLDSFGSRSSALHMSLSGEGPDGKPKKTTFYLIARLGHGALIPATPAILCAKMLVRGGVSQRGAFPCVGIISLPQYLDALKGFDIKTMEEHI